MWGSWGIGALAVVFALARGPGDARAEFEAQLAEAQRLLAAKKFEQAEKVVLAAIAAHPDQDYVLYEWFEVEDLLVETAFWQRYDPPEAADVVHGDLLSWDEGSGKIRIRYRREAGHLERSPDADEEEQKKGKSKGKGKDEEDEEEEAAPTRAGDFFGSESSFLHPVLFKGPYSVELEGSSLEVRDLPIVLVAWRWDTLQGLAYGESYGVAFGDQTALVRVAEGDVSIVDSASTMLRYGRSYSFKVSVTKSTISASYNDQLILKGERAKGEFGQFGFSNLENLDEIVVSGEVEPSWITGLVDERVQHDIQEFRKTFDPFAKLPEWLASRATGESKRAVEFGEIRPQPTANGDQKAFEKAQELLSEKGLEKAVEYVRSLSTPDVSEALKDWVLAHFMAYQGKYADALKHCERVCAQDPGFYEARLLRSRLTSGLGETEKAIADLEQLVLDFPEYLDTYEYLVLYDLLEDRPDNARKALEAAVDNGLPPRELLRAGRTVRRSQHGPSWGQSYAWDTKHYTVVSNLSREASYEIATELEEFHQKYVAHVRRPKGKPDEKVRAYFFAGPSGYHAYTEDLLGDPAENTLGVYSPWLKQLVIWNSLDKRMVLRTTRHEGFHQYLDQITDKAPVWLNEGMAEYFEQSRRVDGRWKDGQVDQDHLVLLDATFGDWTPLDEFVRLDNAGFRAKPGLHYAQGWAFVHFLMSDAKRKKRMDVLLDALFEGATRTEALDRAFDGVDWPKLEAEFRKYVEALE